MAKHNVYLDLAQHELSKMDANFQVYQDNAKLGRLTISKGGVDYYPLNSRKPIKLNWTQFDRMVKEWNS